MTNPYLVALIPTENRLDLPMFSDRLATDVLQAAYSPGESFQGTFLDDDYAPDWARKAARYMWEDFLDNTPGQIKYFGDVYQTLAAIGDGECRMNQRHALEVWDAAGRPGVEPYTTQQDYGSCVDASCAEHESTLQGNRVAHSELCDGQPEEWRDSPAWYKYANRGYCSDGWNGSGIAAVALRVGVAYRKKYVEADFTDDDQNEKIVARTWCRSGIPDSLKARTVQDHSYPDGAITRFQGGLAELKAVFANYGVVHTSARRTSGGSKPYTVGSVGPHMQSAVGMDDSEAGRKWSQDVIGVKLDADDFIVALHQTWGSGWRGECADKYYAPHWGPKPQGVWIWRAKQVLANLSCDYVWMPWAKGFPASTPPVPPVPPPDNDGRFYVDGSSIRGDVVIGGQQYIMVPAGDAKYRLMKWNSL